MSLFFLFIHTHTHAHAHAHAYIYIYTYNVDLRCSRREQSDSAVRRSHTQSRHNTLKDVCSAYGSIRQHTAEYGSIRPTQPHTKSS